MRALKSRDRDKRKDTDGEMIMGFHPGLRYLVLRSSNSNNIIIIIRLTCMDRCKDRSIWNSNNSLSSSAGMKGLRSLRVQFLVKGKGTVLG